MGDIIEITDEFSGCRPAKRDLDETAELFRKLGEKGPKAVAAYVDSMSTEEMFQKIDTLLESGKAEHIEAVEQLHMSLKELESLEDLGFKPQTIAWIERFLVPERDKLFENKIGGENVPAAS